MPSIDVLSVGGTVSVNAHGADFRTSLASTVRSMRVMLVDGTVRKIDRSHDAELFRAVIGGYGLFGVILEVELEAVENAVRQRTVPTTSFAELFENELVPDDGYRMMYAHLSTSPTTFLDEAIVYTYKSLDGYDEPIPPLRQNQDSRVGRLVLNLARHGGVAQRLGAGQRHAAAVPRLCRVAQRGAARRRSLPCPATRPCTTTSDCCGTS